MERFWSKVSKTDGCWLWTRCINKQTGYGEFRYNGVTTGAHVVSYVLSCGPTNGLSVLHSCDVRPCVNPAHLFLGTQAENLADMKAKGRAKKGYSGGNFKLTVEQVRAIRVALRHPRRGLHAELGRKYGVGRGSIRAIAIGRTWTGWGHGLASTIEPPPGGSLDTRPAEVVVRPPDRPVA